METTLSRMDIDGPTADLEADEEMADIAPRAVQKQEKQKKEKKSHKAEEGLTDGKKRQHSEVDGAEKKKKKKKKSTVE